MNVVHQKPNSRRNVRALPLTSNYLIPDDDGTYRWAKPNNSWRLFSFSGQKRSLITNIQFDESEHSPDLWLYSIIKNDDMEPTSDTKTRSEAELQLLEGSRIRLDPGRKWYLRQFNPIQGKLAVQKFTGLPLNAWRAMWRRTIPINEIEIYGLANNQMKVRYAGLTFNVYLRWPELQEDVGNTGSFMNQDGTPWRVSERIMPWLEKNCRGGFIPFSDYDTTFPDEEDEVTYTIDMAHMIDNIEIS